MAINKVQLQLAQISGGGQIPIDQVGDPVGVAEAIAIANGAAVEAATALTEANGAAVAAAAAQTTANTAEADAQTAIINAATAQTTANAKVNSVTASEGLVDVGTATNPSLKIFGGTKNFFNPYPNPAGSAGNPPVLPDADATLFVAPDGTAGDGTHASIFYGGPTTADRTYTLDTAGAGALEWLQISVDGSGALAHNVIIKNTVGTVLYTFPAGMVSRYLATFYANGGLFLLGASQRLSP